MTIWVGMLAGSWLGSRVAGLPGALLGAAFGHWLELKWRRTRSRGRARRPGAVSPFASHAQAYRVLGVPPTASDDAVRKAYRNMAKKCHPDALRAQGASDAAVKTATGRMARVNAAWEEIKSARGL